MFFFCCCCLLNELQVVIMDTWTELRAKWMVVRRYRRRSTAGTICRPSANPNSPRWRASLSRGSGAYGANLTNSKPSPKVLLSTTTLPTLTTTLPTLIANLTTPTTTLTTFYFTYLLLIITYLLLIITYLLLIITYLLLQLL